MARNVIFGLSGPDVTLTEAAFFRDIDPWGFILFARNVQTPEQVKYLVDDLRQAVGRECLVFIDQEGGRVQRLCPPCWQKFPSAARYGELFKAQPEMGKRATYLGYRLMAEDLRQAGITANCAPVLDRPVGQADPIISDRAFETDVEGIIQLGNAAMCGLLAGGIAPVIKHIPGHGRAQVDSHKALPVIRAPKAILEKTDFMIFQAFGDAPMAMTAHVVYSDICDQPATLSKAIIGDVIRTHLGYEGLIMTDDLNMKALSGSLDQRAADALEAGCDIVLHCSGDMVEMVKVARSLGNLTAGSKIRACRAEQVALHVSDFDAPAARTELAQWLPEFRL